MIYPRVDCSRHVTGKNYERTAQAVRFCFVLRGYGILPALLCQYRIWCWTDTIPYEILTNINTCVPRIDVRD